jgi:hypothetical protein
LVFERLNTGGVELERQEIRNCLYHSDFNTLLHELSRLPKFRGIWGLPPYTPQEELVVPDDLLERKFFTQMRDVEAILRFFALRHVEHYQRGMQGFLDLYMARSRAFTKADIDALRTIFIEALDLVCEVYGDKVARVWQPAENAWGSAPQTAWLDAQMIAATRRIHSRGKILMQRAAVIEQTKQLFAEHKTDGLLTGRGNTKLDVAARLDAAEAILIKAAT